MESQSGTSAVLAAGANVAQQRGYLDTHSSIFLTSAAAGDCE